LAPTFRPDFLASPFFVLFSLISFPCFMFPSHFSDPSHAAGSPLHIFSRRSLCTASPLILRSALPFFRHTRCPTLFFSQRPATEQVRSVLFPSPFLKDGIGWGAFPICAFFNGEAPGRMPVSPSCEEGGGLPPPTQGMVEHSHAHRRLDESKVVDISGGNANPRFQKRNYAAFFSRLTRPNHDKCRDGRS